MTTAAESVKLVSELRRLGIVGQDCESAYSDVHLCPRAPHVCPVEVAEAWAWERAMRHTFNGCKRGEILERTYMAIRETARRNWHLRHFTEDVPDVVIGEYLATVASVDAGAGVEPDPEPDAQLPIPAYAYDAPPDSP